MKYKIIAQSRRLSLIDWESFYDPKDYHLVMITNSIGYQELQDSKNADYFYKVILVKDFKSVTLISTLNQFINEEKIAEIGENITIATNDELSLISCAEVRVHFKLKGNIPTDLYHFRDKLKMKEKFKGEEKLLPKYMAYDHDRFQKNTEVYLKEIELYLKYPIFIKPTDDGGSRRTATVHNQLELIAWCKQYTGGNFELDEFISGTLYHCDSIIKDGVVIYFLAGRNNVPCADFMKGKPAGTIPLLETDETFLTLKAFNEYTLKFLSPLPNGSYHMEAFKMPSGELKFLEIAARSPGGNIPEIYKTWKGIDFRAAQLKLQLNLNFDVQIKPGPFQAWIWYPYKLGIFSKITPPEDIKSTMKIEWRKKSGDLMESPKDLVDNACALFLTNTNYEELNKEFDQLSNHSMFECSLVAQNSYMVELYTSDKNSEVTSIIKDQKEDLVANEIDLPKTTNSMSNN